LALALRHPSLVVVGDNISFARLNWKRN